MNFFKPIPFRPIARPMAIAELLGQPRTTEAPSTLPKSVSFDNLVKVVLIPCVNEYKEAGLERKIWTTAAEEDTYKQQTSAEVYAFAEKKGITNKTYGQLFKLFCQHELSQKNVVFSGVEHIQAPAEEACLAEPELDRWITRNDVNESLEEARLEIQTFANNNNISFQDAHTCLFRSPTPLDDETDNETEDESKPSSPSASLA
jgi:hypothetical protein